MIGKGRKENEECVCFGCHPRFVVVTLLNNDERCCSLV